MRRAFSWADLKCFLKHSERVVVFYSGGTYYDATTFVGRNIEFTDPRTWPDL